MDRKCYYKDCSNPATTKEHVPAQCFFPQDHKKQLISVPSCELHNNKKTGEDTYIRNIICMNTKINNIGMNIALSKVFRCFQKDNKLTKELFNSQIKNSILFNVDNSRFNNYFKSFSYAIYRNDFKKNYFEDWFVIDDFLYRDIRDKPLSSLDTDADILEFCKKQKFEKLKVWNLEVFQYFRYRKDNKAIYKFTFYETMNVYSYTIFNYDKIT